MPWPAIAIALLLLLGPSSSFLLPPALAQTSGPEYVVESGDTLFAIALRFGTTVDEILAVNPGLNPNALGIGQRIVIPGYENVSGTLQFHQVEIGETLDSLARRFAVAPSDLMRINRIVNPKTIYLGQSVVYPAQSTPAIAPRRGRLHILPTNSSLMGLAATTGVNPWALASLNGLASPVLTLGGAKILAPDPAAPDVPTDLPAPFILFSINPPQALHGQTLQIEVGASQPVTITGQYQQFGALAPPAEMSPRACLYPTRELRFAEAGNGNLVALQGICAASTAEGEEPPTSVFEITVSAVDSAGTATSLSQLIRIDPANFPKDPPLAVASETLDPANEQREVDIVREVTAGFTPTRLWQGVFQSPSQGDFRSCFGARRAYNDGPYNRYHAGIDYSGQVGTPILAPAPGIVVLAEPEFVVYGGLTILDHGWGVYSAYLHQSLIEVAVGDRVETGQEIGQVGKTGRSLGPHLHWEMWVGGVPIDPLDWLRREIPSDSPPASPRVCFEGF